MIKLIFICQLFSQCLASLLTNSSMMCMSCVCVHLRWYNRIDTMWLSRMLPNSCAPDTNMTSLVAIAIAPETICCHWYSEPIWTKPFVAIGTSTITTIIAICIWTITTISAIGTSNTINDYHPNYQHNQSNYFTCYQVDSVYSHPCFMSTIIWYTTIIRWTSTLPFTIITVVSITSLWQNLSTWIMMITWTVLSTLSLNLLASAGALYAILCH